MKIIPSQNFIKSCPLSVRCLARLFNVTGTKNESTIYCAHYRSG